MKKLLTVLTVICMAAAWTAGLAEGAVVEEKALELAGSSLRFPAVSGMEDEVLQQEVNVRIREDGSKELVCEIFGKRAGSAGERNG